MKALNVTLMFDGITETVFTFYQSVFGGEFVNLQRFKDIPGGPPLPEDQKNKILYMGLPLAGALLSGMDIPGQMPRPVTGTNFTIALDMSSEEEVTRIFEGLAVKGHAQFPPGPQFWATYFGMVTDQFGITWMLSYNK
jgi:PhnB protein